MGGGTLNVEHGTLNPARSAEVADVCIIGVGAVGGILAKELASAGLRVVGFKRGPAPEKEDYAPRDSIRFIARSDQLEWVRHEPTTTRKTSEHRAALQYRTSPLNVLGGALLHWTGQVSRYMPGDFKLFTSEVASGNAERAGADLTGYDIVDWPLTYDDLEPYYERFEWEFGISGQAGMNPFAGPRKRGYPLPPLRHSARMKLFTKLAAGSAITPMTRRREFSLGPIALRRPSTRASRNGRRASIAVIVISTAAMFMRKPRRSTRRFPLLLKPATSI